MSAIVQHRVGNLVISTVRSPHDAAAAKTYTYDFEQLLERLSHPVVVLTDLTHCTVVPQAAVDLHVRLMRTRNRQFLRSALLLGGRGVFAMQVERMVRESGDAQRRVFWDREEAERWLGHELSQPERESLFGYLHHPEVAEINSVRPMARRVLHRSA